MEDDALVFARTLVKNREGVLMGVAVVDLQGQAGALRHVDVRAEGFLLRLAARVGRTEIIQAALPHRDDHRIVQPSLDGSQGLVKGHVVVAHDGDQTVRRGVRTARVQGRVVGVDRDRDAHALVSARQLDHRIEVGQLAGARNHPGDPHLAGAVQLILKAERHTLAPGDLADVGGQVRVVVYHGRRQGRGRVGPGTRLTRAHARSLTFRGGTGTRRARVSGRARRRGRPHRRRRRRGGDGRFRGRAPGRCLRRGW